MKSHVLYRLVKYGLATTRPEQGIVRNASGCCTGIDYCPYPELNNSCRESGQRKPMAGNAWERLGRRSKGSSRLVPAAHAAFGTGRI